jgi:hypothetical protein
LELCPDANTLIFQLIDFDEKWLALMTHIQKQYYLISTLINTSVAAPEPPTYQSTVFPVTKHPQNGNALLKFN